MPPDGSVVCLVIVPTPDEHLDLATSGLFSEFGSWLVVCEERVTNITHSHPVAALGERVPGFIREVER